jgi:hypothetical protein
MLAIGIVRLFGELVREAEKRTIQSIIEEKAPTEPDITNRYMTNLENAINQHRTYRGIKFDGAVLKDRGPDSPESRFGADFVGVLKVNLKGYKQSKGFLCQAKKEGNLVTIQNPFFRTTATFRNNQEFERLKGQTEDMLDVTPDSFVIVYSSKGFMVVPASSVNGLSTSGTLYAKPAVRFFKEFLMCFIGDPKLTAWDIKSLEAIRTEYKARRAIMFSISETNDDADRKPERVIYH